MTREMFDCQVELNKREERTRIGRRLVEDSQSFRGAYVRVLVMDDRPPPFRSRSMKPCLCAIIAHSFFFSPLPKLYAVSTTPIVEESTSITHRSLSFQLRPLLEILPLYTSPCLATTQSLYSRARAHHSIHCHPSWSAVVSIVT